MHPLLEVCVETLEAARTASLGGADRIELCSALADGGVTPSLGLLEQVLASVNLPVHSMIRPRGGDFCYSKGELQAMMRDVRDAQQAGAAAVVLGVLHENGRVDVEATRYLVEFARPMRVTFHRAFDVTGDLERSLDDVIATGADILLTSGGAARLIDATSLVTNLVERAGDRIAIMGGSGVTVENAAILCEKTGIAAIHGSLRRPVRRAAGTLALLPDALPASELLLEDVRAVVASLGRSYADINASAAR